jgi:EmrB/QacA subfamily drug resistance transporter
VDAVARGAVVTSDRTAAPAGPDPRRWRILGVLGLSLLLIGLDNTILNVALPTLQRDLDVTGSSLQWIVDAYILAFAALLLPMGALADRFGRKRMLQAGLTVFGLASLAAVACDAAWQVIAVRALMGAGGAMIMPSTLSIVAAVFPPEERGRAIGAWAGIAGLGIGLGPLVGGVLVESYSWSAVFLLNVPVAAAALLLGHRLVPESRDPEARRLDVPGALLSVVALTALVDGIIEAPDRGWLAPASLGVFAIAAAALVAFLLWERHTATPMLQLSFFRDRRFSVGALSISMAFLALFGTVFLVTQYLQLVHGYSAMEAGWRVAPISVGLMIGAGMSHRLVVRLGVNRVVAGGLLLLAALLASLAAWGTGTSDWVIVPTLVGFAFAMGNVMAPATDSVLSAVPEAQAGVGSAMNDVTRQVGGALGVAIMGSVMSSIYGSSLPARVPGVPAPALDAAGDSVGAADAVAANLPARAGAALVDAAHAAFVDGLGVAVIVGAGVAAACGVVALRLLPSRRARSERIEHTTAAMTSSGAR